MELASMIAGEPFSDHPQCVCPVLAGFLRSYNDALSDRRRQDLYAYAAKSVGTRGELWIELERVARCNRWAAEMQASRRWLPRRFRRVDLTPKPVQRSEAAGARAARAIGRHTSATHAQALALLDELCEVGSAQHVAVPWRRGTQRRPV